MSSTASLDLEEVLFDIGGMAAILDLINERSIEQGVDYAFLLILPGDWRSGRFAGEIRRSYGGDLLGRFAFGSPVYADGKTSIPVLLSAEVTASLPRTVGAYWVYDLEGFLSSPVRLVQGRLAVNPEVTLSEHLPPSGFEAVSPALLLEGLFVPRLVVEVSQTQLVEYREPGLQEVVQGISAATAQAIALHNSDPLAHSGNTVRQTFSNANVTVNAATTLLSHTGSSLTGLRTITLPTGVAAGYQLTIVDESGLSAWWFPLRIAPPSGTINGKSSLDISFPYQSALVTYDGSNWFASLSNPLPDFYLQNQLFSRSSGTMSSGVVIGGRGLDVAVDLAGSGYQITGRHASAHLGGLMYLAGATSINTDRAYVAGGENLIFPDNTVRFLCGIRSIRLNDGTNDFNYSFGFRDAVTTPGALSPADGVYFSYGDTNNPVAANWTATTANNGTRTRVDTGVAVTPGAVQLGIEISPTDARFFVNNSHVATITTNIPRGIGRDCGVRAGFNRIAGSGSVNDILLVSELKYLVLP